MKINCKSCLSGDCERCENTDCLCFESHSIRELTRKFTELATNVLPKSPEELKQLLRNDIDRKSTVDSDSNEFRKDPKGGFYFYDQKNMKQSFAKDLVSDIMLPGHVFDGKDSCGKWNVVGCLQGDLHGHKGGWVGKTILHCNNKGCRKCTTSSIRREAKAITDRLMTFCNLKKNKKIYQGRNRSRILSHVVVSIPYEEQSGYLSREGRKELRKKTISILKKFDVDGGVMIDHPYRFSEKLESARFSPHFHFILTGWIDGRIVKEIYQKTGWIVSQLSTIESQKDCYNLSKYLLSHAAVFLKEAGKRSSEHSVRYFGECHNKKFKVEKVLKYSITGYSEMDSVVLKRKEITKKGIDYTLQKVVYTHSIIKDEIKDVRNIYYEEAINGNPLAFSKSLKQFIKVPKDNPAIPQSEPPSMEFLQMRFDYGKSWYGIVQSVYVNIIFDQSLDRLCPECTMEMEILTPPDTGWTDQQEEMIGNMLKDLPEGEMTPFDDLSLFDSLRNTRITHLGMPYFDEDYKQQYDSGIYQRPGCLEFLNSKLYWSIIKNVDSQQVKYLFKLQNGRAPTYEELQIALTNMKPVKSKNQNLMNF